nr:hypothetical protein [uncultured Amphritea sp.]
MESLGITYAKAVDELSVKIFIPAFMCSLLVELGPWLSQKFDLHLVFVYLIVFFVANTLGFLFLYLIISISTFSSHLSSTANTLGILLMPLGFLCLFPDQFQGVEAPFSAVTGAAILVWSFILVKGDEYIINLITASR